MLKQCSICKELLPYSKFHKDSSKTSGLQSMCKRCKLNYNKCKSAAAYAKYSKSEKGKLRNHRSHSKRRELASVQLTNNPFHKSVNIEWHHVTNLHVVALPADLHQSFQSNSRQMHRDLLESIVIQIYGDLVKFVYLGD